MHEPVMLRSLNWQDNSAVQHATEPPLGNALPIPIEIFQTSGKWRRPAVLFLHGSTGLTPKYYPLIYYLAQQGYVIFVPRYLAQPGRSLAGESAIRANFAAWLRTLMNVLAQMTSWPGIRSKPCGCDRNVIGCVFGTCIGFAMPCYSCVCALDRGRTRGGNDIPGIHAAYVGDTRWLRQPRPGASSYQARS